MRRKWGNALVIVFHQENFGVQNYTTKDTPKLKTATDITFIILFKSLGNTRSQLPNF